jgi:hypothetical protein
MLNFFTLFFSFVCVFRSFLPFSALPYPFLIHVITSPFSYLPLLFSSTSPFSRIPSLVLNFLFFHRSSLHFFLSFTIFVPLSPSPPRHGFTGQQWKRMKADSRFRDLLVFGFDQYYSQFIEVNLSFDRVDDGDVRHISCEKLFCYTLLYKSSD